MAYDDPEPDDPHTLVGVSLPGSEAATREMAEAFADEFAQMGFERERILNLFRSSGYRAAYAALQALGEDEVGRIVDESLRVWGSLRSVVIDSPDADSDLDSESAFASLPKRRHLPMRS